MGITSKQPVKCDRAGKKLQSASSREAVRILVRGRVQGVGFRPFVFRLAQKLRLVGDVRNTGNGAEIELEGPSECLERFCESIASEAPGAAEIEELTVEAIPVLGRVSFAIGTSESSGQMEARVPYDLAICAKCRADVVNPADRRRNYPFTNCTSCGPRYSILSNMPYDRPATVMRLFTMCKDCAGEYGSPNDRRFHAQPNACPACGPQVELWDSRGQTIAGMETAISTAAELLRKGGIVALKGLGGFQLVVRADSSDAVRRLRDRKNRPSKPLAVMLSSLEAAEEFAVLEPSERRLLESAQNPIVLVRRNRGHGLLCPEIAPRVGTLGIFLPTTPLHHLLLRELDLPLVVTSGNRSEEPIVVDEGEAIQVLGGIADAFLIHNRPISRRVDDSVAQVIAGQPVIHRVARGFAPLPLPALERLAESGDCSPILATGGHQKIALAVWTGTQAVLTQHIGDLDHTNTREAFIRAAQDLSGLYHFVPKAITCDFHPDYFTTQWAFGCDCPVTQVQHHHAHAVACMVEHDLLDREVLALTWDGTGYGPDGTIWGGEILKAGIAEYERVASLLPFPLPGGEAAIRHPNRAAFGLLFMSLGEETARRVDLVQDRLGLPQRDVGLLATMIRRGVNTPWTSSMGRLFDGVAALVLGIREVSYEGEAAVWLEAMADVAVTGPYELPLRPPGECQPAVGDCAILRGDWRPMISSIVEDLASGVEAEVIAGRFHNALAAWGAVAVGECYLPDVVLSGGCFQNRLLAERTCEAIRARNRSVYLHRQIPPGDGGLSVGQLAVAMAKTRTNPNRYPRER